MEIYTFRAEFEVWIEGYDSFTFPLSQASLVYLQVELSQIAEPQACETLHTWVRPYPEILLHLKVND